METTFVVSKDELDINFLDSLKKLFKHSRLLQISVNTSEDFNLNQQETPIQYLARLEKCLSELSDKKNTIEFTESAFEDLIIEK